MTDMTFGAAPQPANVTQGTQAAVRRSLFARITDAIIAGRMRRVQRDIDRHLALLPTEVLHAAGWVRVIDHHDAREQGGGTCGASARGKARA